jgi:hypothetical protein
MSTKPSITTNKTEDGESLCASTPSVQTKPDIYPEVSDWLKGSVIWLGLVFVVMVIFVQYFSGYS